MRTYSHMGEGIVERRHLLGLSQQALAERAGINRAHLSQVESGRITWPSAHMRRQIAKGLGVGHVQLLIWAGEVLPSEVGSQKPEPVDEAGRICARIEPLMREVRWDEDRINHLIGQIRFFQTIDRRQAEQTPPAGPAPDQSEPTQDGFR